MTATEYTQRLIELRNAAVAKTVDAVIIPSANQMLAEVKNRITRQGVKTDGGKIGNYSTEPMYASKEQFIKKSAFKPQGKAGKPKRGQAKPKTMYLPSGYKQLRDIQGRPTDTINENYTGDTLLSYQQEAVGNGIVQGFVNTRAAKIREGQEKRFGKIFSPTKEELENYAKRVGENLSEIQRKILNAK